MLKTYLDKLPVADLVNFDVHDGNTGNEAIFSNVNGELRRYQSTVSEKLGQVTPVTGGVTDVTGTCIRNGKATYPDNITNSGVLEEELPQLPLFPVVSTSSSQKDLNCLEEDYYKVLRLYEAMAWADSDDVNAETKASCYGEINYLLERLGSLFEVLQKNGRKVPVKLPRYMEFDRNFWGGQFCLIVAEAEALFHPFGGFGSIRKTCEEMVTADEEVNRAFYTRNPNPKTVMAALYRYRLAIMKVYSEKTKCTDKTVVAKEK